jgi:hypothetical protein
VAIIASSKPPARRPASTFSSYLRLKVIQEALHLHASCVEDTVNPKVQLGRRIELEEFGELRTEFLK